MKNPKCLYCPGTDIFGIYVDKAYRRGGSSYHREDGEYWNLDEFFQLEDNADGIMDGGSVALDVCLDCYRIQGFAPTTEQKQALIDAHINHGRNPLQVERERKARQAANKKEREDRQHLYDSWKQDYNLYVFYKKDDQGTLDAVNKLINSLNEGKAKVGIAKLEWDSTAAFKLKIRYSINTPAQCCLTDKRGGDIVRLVLPESAQQLIEFLNASGYRKEAQDILPPPPWL